MAPKKPKNYYAVLKGRVDEPTIFSSWSDVHPRVTGCPFEFKGFATLKEARKWMEERGVTNPIEVIKDGAGEATLVPGSKAFYAVANGTSPGIYEYWYCSGETKPKCFRTRAQAEAFIEDWKQTVASIYGKVIREALDKGFRPDDMKFNIEGILHKPKSAKEDEDDMTKRLDKLNVKDESE
ncbi:hypothetical protein B0T24DRAFT_658794 [Lasiosphaeria ovina]|uniref:Ribonuclease H1 N-terminal domain-containing protein n=1 Tax=Lasiosphaeria ovina TaxID=92902 RepID=A0AAE0K3L1_9PEZI|nr:hypothetical protein B0T24DRAFT_658794 [Lasiosphaeria ovina]